MKFNIDDYKGKYAMHCKTEAEAIDFCNYLDSVGKHWSAGDSYKHYTFYNNYKEKMCYNFNYGTYANIEWYRSEGFIILEWSDFMNRKFTKEDLKTGDVVKFENEKVGIVNRVLDMIIVSSGWVDIDHLNSDLTIECGSSDWSIVEVRRPQVKGDCQFRAIENKWGVLVYERKEPEEMTLAEVCRLLGKEVKIVK